MLYSRTLLFIHPMFNSLHLLIPNSQSIPPHPPALATTSLFSTLWPYWVSVFTSTKWKSYVPYSSHKATTWIKWHDKKSLTVCGLTATKNQNDSRWHGSVSEKKWAWESEGLALEPAWALTYFTSMYVLFDFLSLHFLISRIRILIPGMPTWMKLLIM